MTSLRRTAFLWFAALMAVVGVFAAVVSYLQMTREAGEFLDDQLRQVAIYASDDSYAPTPSNPPSHDPEDDFLIQVWDKAGRPLRISDTAIPVPRGEVTGFATVFIPKQPWRVYTLVQSSNTVQISQRMTVRQELAAEAALRTALPIGLLIPLTWIVLSFVVDRVMAGLSGVARRVTERNPLDDHPIPTEDVPREVLPFVKSINQLLASLRGHIEHQRLFVSDAAHELRTPLAALQIQIGNLRHANRDARLDELLADAESGVRRSASIVTQLLRLARYDAEQPAKTDHSVDLTAVALACVAQAAPMAEHKSLDLGVIRQDHVRCFGQAEDFTVIIGNLIDNAVRYTPEGGAIDVAVTADDHGACVEITDSGTGISPEHMPRIFERFFRAAPQQAEGSGLGLAIAKAAADRNGAAISLENRTDRPGLVARLSVQPRLIVR